MFIAFKHSWPKKGQLICAFLYILRPKSSSSFQMKGLKFLRKKSGYKYNCENLKNTIWKIVWCISFSRSFSFSNSFVGRFGNRFQDIPILPLSWFWISNGIYLWAKVFRFHIESWPEWDSNPRPRAYRAHLGYTVYNIYVCMYCIIYIYIYIIYLSKFRCKDV